MSKSRVLLVVLVVLSVVEADRSCVVQVSTSSVHISSRQLSLTTSADDGCGSVGQPWILRAPTGQHIRVHLLDFAAGVTSHNTQLQQQDNKLQSDGDDEDSCREYGYVEEALRSAAAATARHRQAAICGDQRRDKLVLESNSNVLHVVFNRPLTNSTNINFLLRFYGELPSCELLRIDGFSTEYQWNVADSIT